MSVIKLSLQAITIVGTIKVLNFMTPTGGKRKSNTLSKKRQKFKAKGATKQSILLRGICRTDLIMTMWRIMKY